MSEQVLAFTGGAKEETLAQVLEAVQGNNQLQLDYTGGPTSEDPVYIGTAPPTVTVSDTAWAVRKLTYEGTNVTSLEVRTDMAWTNRTSPSPGWN